MPEKSEDQSGRFPRVSGKPAQPEPGAARPGGNDAICFTAGPKGAAFGAGVIHAWLASDRKPPLVAAGISTGAITSAAMRSCYRELEAADPDSLERKRWEWFRRYLDAVTHNPLNFIWEAIPDPVDFFSDSLPVQDLSAQNLPFKLPEEETKSRRHHYLLTKLGAWLAGLPVRIGTIASILVYYVRWTEGYGARLLNPLFFVWYLLKALAGIWWHILRSPRIVREKSFGRGFYRPLFGWPIWLASVSPLLGPVFLGVAAIWWEPLRTAAIQLAAALAIAIALLLVYLIRTARPDPNRKWSLRTVLFEMGRHFFKALDIERGLLSQFELRRGLADIFGTQTLDPALNGTQMHLLIVCAALQQSKQIWPAENVPVVHALSGATAIPMIFPPVRVERQYLRNYKGKADHADVVDGVAIRNNPIPAFFEWCGFDDNNRAVARQLERENSTSLHVVYNVPVDPPGSLADSPPRENIDIVESALASLELEEKRDTRQEVRQTNFVSAVERLRRKASRDDSSRRVAFQIFADEIAPAQEISFRNEWEPTREESLKVAGDGCRAALETLYRQEIKEGTGHAVSVPCMTLLQKVAPRRNHYVELGMTGLPEVCSQCCGVLSYRPVAEEDAPPPGLIRSYGQKGKAHCKELPAEFAHLREDDKPRIVFLGSGGVFRGAFHIGVIGAMQAARVFPDLVIGASVGALMGGALAAITVAPEEREAALVEQLAGVFLEVDKRVALTRTLKNAAKQLGVRARDLPISPAELRRMVLGGSQADAGFAATGAPPALIDALARLFMIPHRRTSEIASEFVAGHFTEATNGFLKEVCNETLSSFQIERFLIGVSLLEPVARTLLGKDIENVHLDRVQPYHDPAKKDNGKKVSFFCTTSFLNARTSLLLGRDFLTEDPTWDFINAALSSSAFPAVFAPRSEADVLPGRGRTDRLFADGGMFDNLPFFPAIEILQAGQTSWREREKTSATVLPRVRRRTARRDIIIAAGLNAAPGPEAIYDTLFKIKNRAKSLSVESKVQTFIAGARMVKDALEQIGSSQTIFSDADAAFLDCTVNAAILNIAPTGKSHINPTFAFCKSAGMNPTTVQKSIADGCYRSLSAFLTTYGSKDTTLQAAFKGTNVPALSVRRNGDPKPNQCPYFSLGEHPLVCPFAGADNKKVAAIREVCSNDESHQEQSRDL